MRMETCEMYHFLTQIARRLGIKYSTAKTLTRNYRSIPEEQNTLLVNALC